MSGQHFELRAPAEDLLDPFEGGGAAGQRVVLNAFELWQQVIALTGVQAHVRSADVDLAEITARLQALDDAQGAVEGGGGGATGSAGRDETGSI